MKPDRPAIVPAHYPHMIDNDLWFPFGPGCARITPDGMCVIAYYGYVQLAHDNDNHPRRPRPVA